MIQPLLELSSDVSDDSHGKCSNDDLYLMVNQSMIEINPPLIVPSTVISINIVVSSLCIYPQAILSTAL